MHTPLRNNCLTQAQVTCTQITSVQKFTFFMRVAIADFRALLYMRCFSESRMRCLAFCFASITNADLATLHCLCGAAVAEHRRVRGHMTWHGQISCIHYRHWHLLDVSTANITVTCCDEYLSYACAKLFTSQELAATQGWAGGETAG